MASPAVERRCNACTWLAAALPASQRLERCPLTAATHLVYYFGAFPEAPTAEDLAWWRTLLLHAVRCRWQGAVLRRRVDATVPCPLQATLFDVADWCSMPDNAVSYLGLVRVVEALLKSEAAAAAGSFAPLVVRADALTPAARGLPAVSTASAALPLGRSPDDADAGLADRLVGWAASALTFSVGVLSSAVTGIGRSLLGPPSVNEIAVMAATATSDANDDELVASYSGGRVGDAVNRPLVFVPCVAPAAAAICRLVAALPPTQRVLLLQHPVITSGGGTDASATSNVGSAQRLLDDDAAQSVISLPQLLASAPGGVNRAVAVMLRRPGSALADGAPVHPLESLLVGSPAASAVAVATPAADAEVAGGSPSRARDTHLSALHTRLAGVQLDGAFAETLLPFLQCVHGVRTIQCGPGLGLACVFDGAPVAPAVAADAVGVTVAAGAASAPATKASAAVATQALTPVEAAGLLQLRVHMLRLATKIDAAQAQASSLRQAALDADRDKQRPTAISLLRRSKQCVLACGWSL